MRPTPYATVVRDPRVARLLPGFAASYLGDGMSAIAVSWLALQLAPPGHSGLAVAMAVAAYSFPAAIGTFALAAPLRGRPAPTWSPGIPGSGPAHSAPSPWPRPSAP